MLFYFYAKVQQHLRLGCCGSGGRNVLGRVCVRGRGRGSNVYF